MEEMKIKRGNITYIAKGNKIYVIEDGIKQSTITLAYTQMLLSKLKGIYRVSRNSKTPNKQFYKYLALDEFINQALTDEVIDAWLDIDVGIDIGKSVSSSRAQRYLKFYIDKKGKLQFIKPDYHLCTSCGIQKPLTEFHKKKRGYGKGVTSMCKQCINKKD